MLPSRHTLGRELDGRGGGSMSDEIRNGRRPHRTHGDITATPFNPTEQMIATVIMLLSGMLWGYLIGTFAGLAANLSPTEQEFRAELSQLNKFMSRHKFPNFIRYQLREYFHETIHLRDDQVQKALQAKLSPAMQLEVCWAVNHQWIEKVWYFQKISSSMMIDLAKALKSVVFPPREFCPSKILYIVERGSAFWGGHIRKTGEVWGDDIVLEWPNLELNFPALCCTYVWAFMIHAKRMKQVMEKYPIFLQQFKKRKKRWIFRRALVAAAEEECAIMGKRFRDRLYPLSIFLWATSGLGLGACSALAEATPRTQSTKRAL